MASEMWMRLKTARKAAGKTQLDLAKAIGITRSGYAFLETDKQEHRTNPTITQLRTISEQTGVPLDLIVDDQTDVSEIVRSTLPGYVHRPREVAASAPAEMTSDMRSMFWTAVRFACMSRGGTSARFDTPVAPAPLELRVDFLSNKTAAMLAAEPSPGEVLAAIGALLSVEKALSKTLNKMLLIFSMTQAADVRSLIAQTRSVFGIEVRVVGSAEQAADILQHLG